MESDMEGNSLVTFEYSLGGMAGTRRFKKRRRQQDNKNDSEKNIDTRKPYEPILRENEDFVKYYKKQGIVSDEEWDEFIAIMKKDLPTAFRITSCSKNEAQRLLEIVKGDFFEKLVNPDDDAERKPPKQLPWYPNELGWQLDLTRKDIRRSEVYFRLHNFLISETATGYISRQETVSMIPPLLLDISPHHKVLDMCAAPGSKTAQLIEELHSDQSIPDGFVIANDIDNSRCYMLVHQAKRLNSPTVLIINHDATALPTFVVNNEAGTEEPLKFDRILCDVPCTGDGTLRKNPDIWLKWNPANGSNLHGLFENNKFQDYFQKWKGRGGIFFNQMGATPKDWILLTQTLYRGLKHKCDKVWVAILYFKRIQYRILRRGIEMLTVGGRIVYSTCSMNPVENEAVISRIIIEAKGSVELIDGRSELAGLKTRPGLSKWFPAAKDVTFFEEYEQVEEKWQTQVRPHMFPPSEGSQPLEKCIRILPQDQDTGCFFVAVLQKVDHQPWASSKYDSGLEKIEKKKEKRRKIQGFREDPYVFFKGDEEIWKSIQEFYNIDGMDPTLLLTRCADGKKKNIYLVSNGVKDIVVNNQDRIKMINTGVKVFARCDNKSMGCSFRLVQEGLYTIEPYIKPGRRITLCKNDLVQLLEHADPKDSVPFNNLTEETQEQSSKISQGSCVLDYSEPKTSMRLVLVGWRGNSSLRVYITVQEAVHFLRLLGQNVNKYEVNKFKKDDVKDEVPEGEGDAPSSDIVGEGDAPSSDNVGEGQTEPEGLAEESAEPSSTEV